MGLKSFNRTGQENTTTEVLRPTVTPAARRRDLLLILVVIGGVLVLGWVAFLRSGLSLIPAENISHGLGDAKTGGGNPDTSD